MMPYWLLLSTRNWRTKPGRAIAAMTAIALGVGTVVWVTCSYESVRRSIADQVGTNWLGKAHLSVESVTGHWGRVEQKLVEPIARLPGVQAVSPRLKRRSSLLLPPGMSADSLPEDLQVTPNVDDAIDVDAVGIDPATEYEFRRYEGVQGRLLRPEDERRAVLEQRMAEELGLKIGDKFTLRAFNEGPTGEFQVVGLFSSRRIAKFQQPMVLVRLADLQAARGEPELVTAIDVMVTDPTPENIDAMAERVRQVISTASQPYQVTSGAAKIKQLNRAREQTEFVLMLVASVALLTAFFIILTTMSMGMVERIGMLGTLRCVGTTRWQIVWVTMMEVIPLGIVGLALGVPIGIGLTWLSTIVARQYLQAVAISPWGVWMALIGGAITTFGGALIPALQAGRVSPLAATKPEATPARDSVIWLAAVLGLLMIGAHSLMVFHVPPRAWHQRIMPLSAIALLYVGYGLLAPLLIRFGAVVIVRGAAALLGIRWQLLNDQVGRAAWRSGGICCGLMVGLSLIISVSVHTESMIAGWDFPKRLAEAFVWTVEPVSRETAERMRHMPGVKRSTLVNELYGDVMTERMKRGGVLGWLRPKSVFVAGDAETFLTMAELEFIEGERQDARAKLARGGYVLLPPESQRTFGLHKGDKLTMTVGGISADFEVAGVVKSPALDIAVSYFQADSYMMLAAAGSVLGTLEDAQRVFKVEGATLLLMNFDLVASKSPEIFAPKKPPALDATAMAQHVLAWADAGLISEERETFEWLTPQLRAWAGNVASPLVGGAGALAPGTRPDATQDAAVELRRFEDAWKYVVDQWGGMNGEERWELFREQLVLRRIAAFADRPRGIFGSIARLKQAIDHDIREATLLFTAIPIVALIVASIGVGNLMMANVSSRVRQIAILRAVGTTKWQIVRMVLGEALVLGAIGSLIGVVLGMHSAYNLNELTYRTIGFRPIWAIPWHYVFLGILFAVGVCIAAGIAPARHAARNNIVDALQTA
ncbi:MAG TPA: FtsX-like permease family protein [Phycisphaerae bacterium]|jgi:putative ABC transport system permease protein